MAEYDVHEYDVMTERYDPTVVALVTELLKSLGGEAEPEGGYVDQLRELQVVLFECLQTGAPEPTPEQEQMVRQAVGRLDPKNMDEELDYLDMVRRLQAAVDKEIFKWDSALVQPPGPSGEAQVALTEETPIPEALRPA